MKKIFADANQSSSKLEIGLSHHVITFNWCLSAAEVRSIHEWYFSHHPTRASRNAGGSKKSRPALRKARNVV